MKNNKGIIEMSIIRKKLQDLIEDLSDLDIIAMWNERCQNYRYDEDEIFYMGELDELCCDLSATELIERLSDSFSTADEYFQDTIYGYKSFSDIYDVVDTGELIDYIIGEDADFSGIICNSDSSEIRDILDGTADDNDEEEEG